MKMFNKRAVVFVIPLILVMLVLPLCLAENVMTPIITDTSSRNTSSVLYFFYGDGCPHCAVAEPFLVELQGKYNFTVISFETWKNSTNLAIFQEFLTNYSISKSSQGVPAFFMGEKYMIGFDNKDSRGKELEEIVKYNLKIEDNQTNPNQPESIRFNLFGKNIELSKNTPLLILGMILGFIDGLFPCNLAILLFLMSYLFTLYASKKKILRMGLIFVFIIFLVYSSLMMGLISTIAFIGFKEIGRIIISTILIVMGLINIKDFFFHGIGPSLEIPKFARPILERYVKKATIPAVIVLAFLLSIVTLGCTLGLPLAYIGVMLNQHISTFSTIMYILWYNLFYVLPLIIVVFLIYFLMLESDKAEQYRQKMRKYVKIIGGILMILLAIAMLLNWF